MDYNKDYLPLLKTRVKEKRYIHTLGVIDEALIYAKHYGVDLNKARIAASLHDINKYLSEEENKKFILRYLSINEYEKLPKGARHAYSAYSYAKDELGIDDIEILDAIKNHTTGRIGMTILEKIIFMADFTDPNRGYEDLKMYHDLTLTNIDMAITKAIEVVIQDIKERGEKINQDTICTYNYYRKIAYEQ